jgi:hypothetical protein
MGESDCEREGLTKVRIPSSTRKSWCHDDDSSYYLPLGLAPIREGGGLGKEIGITVSDEPSRVITMNASNFLAVASSTVEQAKETFSLAH